METLDAFVGSLPTTERITVSELNQRFQSSDLAYKFQLIKELQVVPVESFAYDDALKFIEIVVAAAEESSMESRRVSAVFDQNTTARFENTLNRWKSQEDISKLEGSDIVSKLEESSEVKRFSFLDENDNPFGSNKDDITPNKSGFSFSNPDKNVFSFFSPSQESLYFVADKSSGFENLEQPDNKEDLKLSDLTEQSFFKAESPVEEVEKKALNFSFLDQFGKSNAEVDSFRLSANDCPQDEDSFHLNKEKENSFHLSNMLEQESPEFKDETKSFRSDKKYVPSKLSENILKATPNRTPSKVTFDKSALDSAKSLKSKPSDRSFSDSLFDASLNKVLNKSLYDENSFQIGSFDYLQNGRQNLEKLENVYETNDFPVHTPEQKHSSIPLPRSKKTPIPERILDYQSPIEKLGGMVGYEEQISPTKGDHQLQNALKDLHLLEEKYQELKITNDKKSQDLKNQKSIVEETKKNNERLQNENYSLELSKSDLESLVRVKTNEVGNIVKKYTGNCMLIDLQQELMECQSSENSTGKNNELKIYCENLEKQVEDLKKAGDTKDLELLEIKEDLAKCEGLRIEAEEMRNITTEILHSSTQTTFETEAKVGVSTTRQTDLCSTQTNVTQTDGTEGLSITIRSEVCNTMVCTQTDSLETSNMETNTAIKNMINQDTFTDPEPRDNLATQDNSTSVYIQTSTIEETVHKNIIYPVFKTTAIQTDELNLDISCVQMQDLDISTINPYENDLDVKFANLTEEIEQYTTQKQELKQQIQECQSQTMSIRKDLDVRAHYDQEMERWIENLLKKVLTTQQEVGMNMVQFEKERKRGKMLWERFECLKCQKVNVRTQTKVSGVVIVGSKGVQTDKDSRELVILDRSKARSNLNAEMNSIERRDINGMAVSEKIEMRWTKILNFLMIVVSCLASYVIFVEKWMPKEVQEEIMVVI